MRSRESLAEELILDVLRAEAPARALTGVLLIGMQACSTVSAANQLVGSDRVVLLHLDRAAGGVGCGPGNREVFVGDERGLYDGHTGAGAFTVVGLNVEAAKNYRLLREVVGQTARYVAADGVVFVAGPKKGGADVAARVLREVFESVSLVTYRKGQRVYRASRPLPPVAPSPEALPGTPGSEAARSDGRQRTQEIVMVALRGHQLRLLQDERIFARGRLDPATRMLAEVFEVPSGAAVLDLGCGSGILGILAGLLEPTSHSWLVDSDPLAAEVSRQNAALNGVSNVSIILSDVLRELPGQTFDVVLMNPPFHRGRVQDVSLAERFMTEASRALRPGAAVYVVCNRFLRYEPTLERLVGPVQEVAGDRQFKVLLARLQRPG